VGWPRDEGKNRDDVTSHPNAGGVCLYEPPPSLGPLLIPAFCEAFSLQSRVAMGAIYQWGV
jgi:hypothetical protein